MKPPKGLKISQVRPGDGPVAELGKFAVIRYDCYLPRGEMCDSSGTNGIRCNSRLVNASRILQLLTPYWE